MTQHWTVMPNFVDCSVFRPVGSLTKKQALRKAHGIPPDALVVGCVAAIKKDHKRIDYLIREFGSVRNSGMIAVCTGDPSRFSPFTPHAPFLLIAGAVTSETDELWGLAESLAPGRYQMLRDCPRRQMPELYQMMDVFVLPSLFEMMPIALLEALASGLPCLVHQHPVLEWMVGAGDEGRSSKLKVQHSNTGNYQPLSFDFSRAGVLTGALMALTPEWMAAQGRRARARAVRMFSRDLVIAQYARYYRDVMGR
jgi:glycosyltransferase involved in cell wall biosynthesis